jgi:hypothetical protein
MMVMFMANAVVGVSRLSTTAVSVVVDRSRVRLRDAFGRAGGPEFL